VLRDSSAERMRNVLMRDPETDYLKVLQPVLMKVLKRDLEKSSQIALRMEQQKEQEMDFQMEVITVLMKGRRWII
jgi:hypothetical protein